MRSASSKRSNGNALGLVIVFSETALRKIIAEYLLYYGVERPHQGIDKRIIERRRKPTEIQVKSVKRARLGGLLQYYYRPDDPRVGDGTVGKEEKRLLEA